jgi:hypothetical protein
MQINIAVLLFERGPFASGFLNPVFTKTAVPLFKNGLDPFIWLHLGHGNQLYRPVRPSGIGFGLGNAGGDILQ